MRRRNGTGSESNRTVRLPDALWVEYDAACAAEGVTRTEDLRRYMRRKVWAWRQRTPVSEKENGLSLAISPKA